MAESTRHTVQFHISFQTEDIAMLKKKKNVFQCFRYGIWILFSIHLIGWLSAWSAHGQNVFHLTFSSRFFFFCCCCSAKSEEDSLTDSFCLDLFCDMSVLSSKFYLEGCLRIGRLGCGCVSGIQKWNLFLVSKTRQETR